MKITKAKFKILPVVEIVYLTDKGRLTGMDVANKGIVVKQYEAADREQVKAFLQNLKSKEGKEWKDRLLVDTTELYYKRRSLEQNSLMWALLTILSMEVYQDKTHPDVLYQDMLNATAPREVSKLTGNDYVIKTSSKQTTIEFSRGVEWIIQQLMDIGFSFTEETDFIRYWNDWQDWRSEQKTDPLTGTYKSIEDYREKVCYCEACLIGIKPKSGDGHMAHIVSKGATNIQLNVDDLWNFIHLCTKCHIGIQHQNGWKKLLRKSPHLLWRVNAAREKIGLNLFEKEAVSQGEFDDTIF